MGVLENVHDGRAACLGKRHLVGRGSTSHLKLKTKTVSAEHAVLFFDGGWWLRDLGSRNGTRLNGKPIEGSRATLLELGDAIQFGSEHHELWRMVALSPPGPSARPIHGARIEGEMTLWLPPESEPTLCVVATEEGWHIQDEDGMRPARNGARVKAAGRDFILELPPYLPDTALETLGTTESRAMDPVQLSFSVSRDQEHIGLQISVAGKTTDLGAKAHNEALLVLARARLADQAEQVSPQEAGWVYARDLAKMLGIDRKATNLQLWRATQLFRQKRLPTELLVERRADAGQLRLGYPHCLIQEA